LSEDVCFRKGVTRRGFLTVAVSAIVAGVIAGVGGYYAGLAATPAKEITRTVERTVTTATTLAPEAPYTTTLTTTITPPPTTMTKTVTTTVTTTQLTVPPPVTIKAGYVVPAENIISLFEIPFFQENVLKEYGKKYKVDLLRLKSTPDVVAALAAGELNVGHLALISFASAVIRDVVPSGLVIIAGDAWDAYPGYYSFTCLTLSVSPIYSVKDLTGKKIGINTLGTAVHFAASMVLKAHGIDPNKDVTFVEVGTFPNLAPALKEKRIDAGVFPPAYYWQIIGEGIYRKVFDSTDGFAHPYPMLFLCARGDFLAANKGAIDAFIEDYGRLMKYILAFENREKVLEEVSKHFGLPREVLANYWLTNKDIYRSLGISKADIEYGLTTLFELRFIDKIFDVTPYIYIKK